MTEQDYWIEDETDGVPPRWPVVDGSGERSRVIAYCPTTQDAERIVAALAASEREQRMRRELLVAREALQYHKDRSSPAALIDRIERAWMAIEVALSEPAPTGPERGEETP